MTARKPRRGEQMGKVRCRVSVYENGVRAQKRNKPPSSPRVVNARVRVGGSHPSFGSFPAGGEDVSLHPRPRFARDRIPDAQAPCRVMLPLRPTRRTGAGWLAGRSDESHTSDSFC